MNDPVHLRCGALSLELVSADGHARTVGEPLTPLRAVHLCRLAGLATLRSARAPLARLLQASPRDDLAERLEGALRAREVLAFERPVRRDMHRLSSPLDEPLSWDNAPLGWIEIELVDDIGRPVAGAPYRVVTPGGGIRSGTLDGRGCAREEGLDEGKCQVLFPTLEGCALQSSA